MKKLSIALTLSTVTLLAAPALAQVLAPAENVGNAIASFLTGGMGRLMGVIAFAGFGIASAMGRIDWRWALAIMIGLIAIFGGAAIVAEIEGLAN